jgi:ribosome-associated protein
MEDMLSATEKIGELLKEHNGQDVSVLDLRGINNWTDFFIISTVTSRTHMDGLEKHVKEFCRDNDMEISGSSRKDTDDKWRLIDLGSIIIHLMTSEARDFYDLDRLWRYSSSSQSSSSSSSSQSSSSSS